MEREQSGEGLERSRRRSLIDSGPGQAPITSKLTSTLLRVACE